MHSKSDNIEIMINDKVDQVIKELFGLLKNRFPNLFSIIFIYCILNVIK